MPSLALGESLGPLIPERHRRGLRDTKEIPSVASDEPGGVLLTADDLETGWERLIVVGAVDRLRHSGYSVGLQSR